MAVRPTAPSPYYATASDWETYANALIAFQSEREREISRAVSANADNGAAAIRKAAGLPKVARNDVYAVTVVRSRVRAASAADAETQVRDALAGVTFTDRSDVRRDFTRNTAVSARKINE